MIVVFHKNDKIKLGENLAKERFCFHKGRTTRRVIRGDGKKNQAKETNLTKYVLFLNEIYYVKKIMSVNIKKIPAKQMEWGKINNISEKNSPPPSHHCYNCQSLKQ